MDRAQKLNALRRLAHLMIADGEVVGPVIAFLAGRLDKVHFVADTSGAQVAVYLSPGARVWPRMPFRAEIDGSPVLHPIAFIERAALRDDEVYVRTDFGAVEPPLWYREVLESGVEDPREYLKASIERLRGDIDLALDVYRTAKEKRDQADGEQRSYLEFALRKAQSDIRVLSNRLKKLEMQLGGD